MIPVVRGAPNSKLYLPNGTYIYSPDFESAVHLAKHLKNLGRDEEKYISYLQEKDKYINPHKSQLINPGLCYICKLLNKNEFLSNKKIDISSWLWENKCYFPNDI